MSFPKYQSYLFTENHEWDNSCFCNSKPCLLNHKLSQMISFGHVNIYSGYINMGALLMHPFYTWNAFRVTIDQTWLPLSKAIQARLSPDSLYDFIINLFVFCDWYINGLYVSWFCLLRRMRWIFEAAAKLEMQFYANIWTTFLV